MCDCEVFPPDAYIVVYAVSDPDSFTEAESMIVHLRQVLGSDRTIYLVANKSDLVRQRLVQTTSK